MLAVNPYDEHVAARLLDFFGRATPWQRKLWGSGMVLSIREVLQASEAVRARVLSESALQNLAMGAVIRAGIDPGVGSEEQKKLLQSGLRGEPASKSLQFDGAAYHILKKVVPDLEENYLSRWSLALQNASSRPRPERTARAIASHLLDHGFSPDYLHRWWTYKLKHDQKSKSLADLVSEAHTLTRQSARGYRILIPFEHAPEGMSGGYSAWLPATQVSEWLRTHGFDIAGVRQVGGFWVEIKERDPWAAVEGASELVDRLASRVSLGTKERLRPTDMVWVDGEEQGFKLRQRQRGVQVRALQREGKLYSFESPTSVDAALEILGPLDSGSPGPAVAGGWAAIEALLSAPGDQERVIAADRMAALVACSFPRAELTALSYAIEKDGGKLAEELKACASNRDRAALLASKMLNGDEAQVENPSDKAALVRLRDLLLSPHAILRDVESHVARELRRLYSHRNIVLHWGKTDAVGLRACLRTIAPLVGAGMDRVAHAWFVDGVRPLELFARARISLDTAGATGAPTIVDLLK